MPLLKETYHLQPAEPAYQCIVSSLGTSPSSSPQHYSQLQGKVPHREIPQPFTPCGPLHSTLLQAQLKHAPEALWYSFPLGRQPRCPCHEPRTFRTNSTGAEHTQPDLCVSNPLRVPRAQSSCPAAGHPKLSCAFAAGVHPLWCI